MGLELEIVTVEKHPPGTQSIAEIMAEMEANIRVSPLSDTVNFPDSAAQTLAVVENATDDLAAFTHRLLTPLCKPYLLSLKKFLESEELRLNYSPSDLRPQTLAKFFKDTLNTPISKTEASSFRAALVGKAEQTAIGYDAVFNIIDELCLTADKDAPSLEIYVNPAYEPLLIKNLSVIRAEDLPLLRSFLTNMQKQNTDDVGEFQIQELNATIPGIADDKTLKEIRRCILGAAYNGGLGYDAALRIIDEVIISKPAITVDVEPSADEARSLQHDQRINNSPSNGKLHLTQKPTAVKKAVATTIGDDHFARFRQARAMLRP